MTISTFLIELHQDDVLKVLLVVRFKFLFYKLEIGEYFRKIHSKVTVISYIKISMSMSIVYALQSVSKLTL